jgi:SAM-dependent methyltransferase
MPSSRAKGSPSAASARKRRHRFSAATADKYELYQKAVQSPDLDVPFFTRLFQRERGRRALHLREDFCGTGLMSAAWIRSAPDRTAEGFDLDPEPVAWGLEHNFAERAGPRRGAKVLRAPRFTAHLRDVRAPGTRAPDLRIALNFSYWVFLTRRELLEYFRAAHESLAPDGVFAIDLYGGPDATEEMEETRRCGGFTYVWDQVRYRPGTGEYLARIHFRFPDGTSLQPFTYHWRFWFLTELADALADAGFRRVDRYFEGTDDKGEGDGNFRKGLRGDNCAAWLAYLVALK